MEAVLWAVNVVVVVVSPTTRAPQITDVGYSENAPGFPTWGHCRAFDGARCSRVLPRMAGKESWKDRFFGTYPASDARGVNPAGVGTVVVSVVVVVVVVAVWVAVVTLVMVAFQPNIRDL